MPLAGVVGQTEAGRGVVTPATEAVSVYGPAFVFAVAMTLASPLASVVAGEAVSAAGAPAAGAVKVTLAPGTGLP